REPRAREDVPRFLEGVRLERVAGLGRLAQRLVEGEDLETGDDLAHLAQLVLVARRHQHAHQVAGGANCIRHVVPTPPSITTTPRSASSWRIASAAAKSLFARAAARSRRRASMSFSVRPIFDRRFCRTSWNHTSDARAAIPSTRPTSANAA